MKTIDYDILAYLRGSRFKLGENRKAIINAVKNPNTKEPYPRTTVLDSLVRLEVKGLVRRKSREYSENRSRGRPKIYWRALI